ncbi:MBL fold metallo-hydrolase [Pendulispora rubella]|uniref:MBL fold metallo-hydrolase n=1 Tax=Pendulispora rubella TaxID=2741070 RepID=A0ABZ2LB26_9BACT
MTQRKRSIGRRIVQAVGLLFLLAVALTVISGWTAFGHRAEGARRARMERSPHWKNGHFVNPEPLDNDAWLTLRNMAHASPYRSPTQAIPTLPVPVERLGTPPPSGLRLTWLGHSSMLVEIDGHRILTDPAWSPRASPVTFAGPERWFPPLLTTPMVKEKLPAIDAVVISHDHYDHLDYGTISAMKDWNTTFVVPLGVGAHLAYWGVPEDRIVELDWWESTHIRDLTIVCTPARHASGRTLIDNDTKLWAGYAFVGNEHRAYFSGDTGLFPVMNEIGTRLGPFDVAMIEIGEYDAAWPDWHLGPEQAVDAHRMVRGRLMVPMHWGLFNLAYHGWTEPIERALAAADRAGVGIVTPKPGQSFEPVEPPARDRWWPDVPWRTAQEAPVVATQMKKPASP